MELSEIGKICLRCMRISDEAEICPHCGREKSGQLTWSKALAPGTVLNNKILIGNILGKGGYGITYIGYDMLLEYRVAVKEFFPDEMVDRDPDGSTVMVLDEVNGEEYQKETTAYLREARVLAEFSKFPGIVSIKDLFYQNNTGYLIMEFLEDGNLRKYIDNHGGWLGVEEALELMEPVISILGRLHKAGLIHRDISPDNIMMDEDGKVKLIDFGGSKKLGINNQQVFLGKWGFAPLEQMLSKISEQGPWTDIYGICATLYCMMTGDVPQASYERNEKDELVNIVDYTITIDKKVARAIMKGLSMDPSMRQQSIDELYKDLYGYAPEEKGLVPKEEDARLMKDSNGRVWFGHYPMNEITGDDLTSDIIYANYNEDGVATVNKERYYRIPFYAAQPMDNNLLNAMKYQKEREFRGYRYFQFNLLSWKVVETKKGRVTLQSEYIIDYRPFDDKKYLKMSDKEVARVKTGIFWEKSKIREWLNSVFAKRVFTDVERGKLLVTGVITPVSSLSDRTTYDRVYIPSIEEIRYGFDADIALMRGRKHALFEEHNPPCSQLVAALADDDTSQIGFGLRSRGPIDTDDSYKCSESYAGHSLFDNKLTAWPLNRAMGIRPVICVNEDDIVNIR